MKSIIEGEISDMDDSIETTEEIHILPRLQPRLQPRNISQILDKNVEEYVPPQKVHYLNDLRDLRKKCLDYKKAHSDCKSFHLMYDKIIKISMLTLSTLTTYFISSHDKEDITTEDLDLDRKLTFFTTLVSGVNAIFNFSEKMEIHKNLNIEYYDLHNDIEETIRLFTETINEEDIKEIFQGYHKKFRELTMRTGDIGLIKCIKTNYEIT